MPRNQLYIYIAITIVAVILGLFSGAISVWLRELIEHGHGHF